MENESKKQDPETINRAVESNDIEKQVNEYIRNAREEGRDKERRKNNLVLFNLNESRKEIQIAKNEDDEAECRRIFVEVGVEGCTVEHMFRLGRPNDNGKHRPLLVKLSAEKEKWTILSRAKRLMWRSHIPHSFMLCSMYDLHRCWNQYTRTCIQCT